MLKHPIPGARITQRFGENPSSYLPTYNGHEGTDFSAVVGTAVYAAHEGNARGRWSSGYGTYLEVVGETMRTIYAHLSETMAELGERVYAGQMIALSGNTGNSTGPHLHFGVCPLPRDYENGYQGYVDPELWLKEKVVVGSKLGVQVQNCKAIPGSWLQRHVREGKVTHALLIDPDVLTEDPWPNVISMGRLYFKGDPDKAAIAKGAAGAREYIEMCKPRWAKCPWIRLWHPPNEPNTGNPNDPNDLDPMKRLAEFSVEMVRLAHIEGELMAVGALATGTPAGPPANPLPTIDAKWRIFAPAMHVADMLAVHQYGMGTLNYTPENEWHIGTHNRAVAIMDEMNLSMPFVWVAEHFIDRAGNPNTDGWRVQLNNDEAEGMRQLAMRDADYAKDPYVVAVTPFTWFDYNWPSFTITEGLSERIMAHRREVGGLPVPEPEPVGALVNGDFEGGFHYHDGVNELYVPNGWTPFYAQPIATWYEDDEPYYDFRPEYKRCGDETNGPKRSVSGFGAQWFTTYAGHRGGIYQQIAATPGQKVTAWASMLSWHTQVPYKPEVSMDEDWMQNPTYLKKVGIDPTGGTDWESANIVWSAGVEVNDVWFILATSAVAQASTVTVFLYGAPKYAFQANNCYVDSVGVTVEGEPEPPVPPTPTNEEIRNAAWNLVGIPYNPDAAFPKYAREHELGIPMTGEFVVGDTTAQGYAVAVVCAVTGDWANVRSVSW